MSFRDDSHFPDGRSLFLAWSTFKGDRETFDTWYDGEHVPQILSAPGMVSAQRFVLDDTKPVPGSEKVDYGHLALYELNGDPSGFREEVKRQLMSGEMVIPDFMNPPFKTLILRPVSAIFRGHGGEPGDDLADRHLFLAFSRPTGEYAPFAEWYDDVHIPQILGLPGIFRAQRFMQSEVKPLPGVDTPDVHHLTLCEFEGSPAAFREGLKRTMMSGEMKFPDFIAQPVGTVFMQPVSRFVSAVAAQA
jgi:hypothetical protein